MFSSLNFIIHNADKAGADDAHQVTVLIGMVDFLVQNPVLADKTQQDQQEVPHGSAVGEIHDIFIQAKLIYHGAKAVMEQVIFILKIAVKRRPGNQRGIADVG